MVATRDHFLVIETCVTPIRRYKTFTLTVTRRRAANNTPEGNFKIKRVSENLKKKKEKRVWSGEMKQ